MAFVNEKNSMRTVDYERNIILRPIPGPAGRNNARSFALDVKDKRVRFSAYFIQEQGKDDQWNITWDIFQISPLSDAFDKAEIISGIAEALKHFGANFSHDGVNRIEVKLHPGIVYS